MYLYDRPIDHEHAVRRVGEALLTRHAEIAAAMLARIVDEIPEYELAPPQVIDDVRALSTATVELLGQTLATGAPLGREYVPIVRDQAARRVHQGVSLDAFLHAYRAALVEFWDACAAEAARLEISRDAGFTLARAAIESMDTLTTHAAEAYMREETRVRTQSGREARDLIERLIRGQPVGDRRRHPAAPGLDPAGRLVAIVGRIEDTSVLPVGDALQLVRDVLEESFSLGRSGPLVAIREGEVVVVARTGGRLNPRERVGTARRRLLHDHDVDVHYGLSTPVVGFASVQQAYRDAALSLSYSSPASPVVSLDDLPALECALIGTDGITRAVIASKGSGLMTLPDEDRAPAVATIRAFADADLNVARAAEELDVHPNTVRYRLERIAMTTGHDPRTFAGLVELVCVLGVMEHG